MNKQSKSLQVFDSSKLLKCSDTHRPIFEIEYEIGARYSVCANCLKLSCFSRHIKSKRGIAP